MMFPLLCFLIPLLFLSGASASLEFLTGRSFGKCLPPTMMGAALLLFFSQLFFGSFQPGLILGVGFALISIPLGFLRRKNGTGWNAGGISTGMIAFLTVYTIVYFYDLRRGYHTWDEFSHWGMMVKEMYRLDRFYYIDASNLMVHKDYPPIMQLFELFWTSLTGTFDEPCTVRALHTFELSLFIPFLPDRISVRHNGWKSIAVGAAGMLSLVFSVLLFDQHLVFDTIYTDYVMALLVVYLLMTVMTNRRITWFEVAILSMGGSYLLLLKQMGLPLYLMILFLLTVISMMRNPGWRQRIQNRDDGIRILLSALALLTPFVLWIIWEHMTKGVYHQFDLSKISVPDFLAVMRGEGLGWQTTTRERFLEALGKRNISTSYLHLTYVQGMFLFVALMWIAGICFQRELDKNELLCFTLTVLLGAVGYAFVMLVLYVLAFGSDEGPILASYERYMGTYQMILILSAVFFIISTAGRLKRYDSICALCLAGFLITSPDMYHMLQPMTKSPAPAYQEWSSTAGLLKTTVEEDARVCVVAQNFLGYHFFLQYYATPIKINEAFIYPWPTGYETPAQAADWYQEIAVPVLEDCDYFYIAEENEEFETTYRDVIGVESLRKGSLYQIRKSEGQEGLTLEKILPA